MKILKAITQACLLAIYFIGILSIILLPALGIVELGVRLDFYLFPTILTALFWLVFSTFFLTILFDNLNES